MTGERILVVDDDPATRVLVAATLREAGHEVDLAEDAREARWWLAQRRFGLAVVDLDMPGETGDQLAEWLYEAHPDIAVLILTATSDRDVAGQVLGAGAYGYLIKPFQPRELVIHADNAFRRRRLEIENRAHRRSLEQRVDAGAAALEAVQDRLLHAQAETIRRLSLAIEFRSVETGRHVERIGAGAAAVAGRLGIDEPRVEMIRLAAVLHDVGKIAIPDAILLKPGPLTPDERREIERHAAVGHELLSGTGSELLELAAEIAWTHHERCDGTGYPRGLAGDAIPVEGRITAVVDVFDALTHERVYRPALTAGAALELMRGERGRQFDPAAFDALLASLDALV